MATPEPIIKMVCARQSAHTRERHTYSVFPDGHVVCDSEERMLSDGKWKKLPPYHKTVGRLKANIRKDTRAMFDAVQDWADRLRNKGWDAEVQ